MIVRVAEAEAMKPLRRSVGVRHSTLGRLRRAHQTRRETLLAQLVATSIGVAGMAVGIGCGYTTSRASFLAGRVRRGRRSSRRQQTLGRGRLRGCRCINSESQVGHSRGLDSVLRGKASLLAR